MVTYDAPIQFHMDGEEADAIPVPHAHTDGDTIVRFHSADVIMCGDFFRSAGISEHGPDHGGSLNGTLDGLAMLVGMAGPNTKIIPGHGVPVDRTAVMAQRDMILVMRDRVAKLIEQGKTSEEVLAAHVTSDYDAQSPRGCGERREIRGSIYRPVVRGTQSGQVARNQAKFFGPSHETVVFSVTIPDPLGRRS